MIKIFKKIWNYILRLFKKTPIDKGFGDEEYPLTTGRYREKYSGRRRYTKAPSITKNQ
jgi:hypothetical protein